MNKILSKSIEQLRQPGSQLEESEEEHHSDYTMQEERVSSTGNIRSHSSTDLRSDRLTPVKVKEEPPDSDDDIQNHPESNPKSAFVQQVTSKDFTPKLFLVHFFM
ncbi:hypothetical protein GDO81_012322 [Engystomops pustulosus]|uniref:histone deacetylase n=3 Tax=Engystomops pustulosus TaxID=76066 RepID=A0AAV7BKK4_ENGPU|nr:hypothetical protein GDO81_012322 [Engystomops pustulosus]